MSVVQALALGLRDRFGHMRHRPAEDVGFARRPGDGLALPHSLLQQIAWRHEAVFLALPQQLDHLLEEPRKRTQAGEVVLVVLRGVERHEADELRPA